MQLILDTETTVDLKTKMSLNEENLEKSVSDILPGVQNGSVSNGDTANGDSEAAQLKENIDMDKLDQFKDSAAVTTERLEHSEKNVLEHNNETSFHCNNINVINGYNSDIKNSVVSVEPIKHSNNLNESEKNTTVEKGKSEQVNNSIEPESNYEAIPENNINELVNENDNTEPNCNKTKSVPGTGSKYEESVCSNSSECVNIKKEDYKTDISCINTEVNIDLDVKKEMSESSCEESEIKQEKPDESDSNLEINDNSMKPTILKTEIEDNTSISEENETLETDKAENDTSDENIDLIRLDFDRDTCDKGNSTYADPVENEKTKSDDTIAMDVDTNTNYVSEKETGEMVLPSSMANAACSEPKDCELIEVDTLAIAKTSSIVSSDDVIVNLDDDKEKAINPVDVKESESTQIIVDDDKSIINCDDDAETKAKTDKSLNKEFSSTHEVIDLDENLPKCTQVDCDVSGDESNKQQTNTTEKTVENSTPIEPILKLSNTLDILSDDEDEVPKNMNTDSKCINIEDDDDVMLIDDDTSGMENKSEPKKETEIENEVESKAETPAETEDKEIEDSKSTDKIENHTETEITVPEKEEPKPIPTSDVSEKIGENPIQVENKKPLIPENFLKTCKKNLVDMTREELEEFCILKIVESILDRSNLSEIKNKLKMLTQNIEDYKKKTLMLSKQNRDLQVVLKSVQEDVKKYNPTSIVPLKITRSVGMQVLMSDKPDKRRRTGIGMPNPNTNKILRTPTMQSPRPQKPPTQQIPVPRLVPANNPAMKSPVQQASPAKVNTNPLPNGVKSVSPVQKAEKRTHNRIQSVTVDLTDDEPPAKVVTRSPAPVPPVRLVPSQNLLAPPRTPTVNSPRKVYIPISGPQGQNIRQIMLKTVPTANPRQRVPPPHMVRMPQSIRMARPPQGLRHPAPLPECMKQYQPPNWKALPPAPDLKLAKVENGIVISWKIEGYQEDSYEEIASYQLYAYQETTSPPNTALWKKIGDVKALPLPMACTLTQFMAGYKYYFAVRAVDIRSRLGPFSLPGSILLLNKM